MFLGVKTSLQELTGNSRTASIYLAGLPSRCGPHSARSERIGMNSAGLHSDWSSSGPSGGASARLHYHQVSPSWRKQQCFQDAGAKRYRIIRTTSQSGLETLSEVGTTRMSFLFDTMSAVAVQLQCHVNRLLFCIFCNVFLWLRLPDRNRSCLIRRTAGVPVVAGL